MVSVRATDWSAAWTAPQDGQDVALACRIRPQEKQYFSSDCLMARSATGPGA